MYVVLGGTGRVGSAVVEALLSRGATVTVAARDPIKARGLQARGARFVRADALDIDTLKNAYQHGERLFMLNPPADPSTDTQAVERETVTNMLRALEGSGIKKVVAQSTFGARAGELLGDLNVLFEMEQGLKEIGIPTSTLRAAYYMSNWESALEQVKAEGVVTTFFPIDLEIPMVAPRDLGNAAARLMMAPIDQTECVYVEGPERYSSAQVAAAFGTGLGRDVKAVAVPEQQWVATFKSLGFSDRAATSYANMTRTVCRSEFPPRNATQHAKTTLHEYVSDFIASTA